MDQTTYSEAMQWTGDHDAAEEWAERLIDAEHGELPLSSVFEGDCHGLYINPTRLAVLGFRSSLTETVLIRPGEWITYTAGEFLPRTAVTTR